MFKSITTTTTVNDECYLVIEDSCFGKVTAPITKYNGYLYVAFLAFFFDTYIAKNRSIYSNLKLFLNNTRFQFFPYIENDYSNCPKDMSQIKKYAPLIKQLQFNSSLRKITND